MEELRKQAHLRSAPSQRPLLHFTQTPITAKECSQMHLFLRERVQQKRRMVDEEKNFDQIAEKYAQMYEWFAQTCQRNEKSSVAVDVQRMHEMGDMLLEPPQGKELYLSSREEPIHNVEATFEQYERSYEAGDRFEKKQSEEVIKRAKQYLMDTHAL